MLKRFMISVVIASLAIAAAAVPQCAGCSMEKEHTGKTTAAKAQKSGKKIVKKAAAKQTAAKAQVKDDCCHKDPFLMEANRMMAASEGKKSSGCKCQDKADAQKAKAKVKKSAKK